MELHSKYWEECLSKKGQEVRRGSFHSDSKTVKIGRNYPVHKFYSRYWKSWEKTHTGHSSVQLPCVSYIVFVILFILLQKRFSLAMKGSNKHNSGKLHDK